MRSIAILFSIIILQGCITLHKAFKAEDQPAAPDYANEKNWAALPFRKDAADLVPAGEEALSDSLKPADVFYVYPTLYLRGRSWNANLKNRRLNKLVDKYPVRFQASVFNNTARIYAPRYRQARLSSFTDTTGNGEQALDFAYEDIKKAFQYYLDHYNHNRPVIIASHSQGTFLCRRLIKDFFDTPEASRKLVCAYIIGYEVDPASYDVLTPCMDAAATNCFVTWSTFKASRAGTGLKSHTLNKISVNPVSWKMDTAKAVGEGGILFDVNRKKRCRTEVIVKDGNLWAKTNAPFFRRINNLHVLDYNLFWFDIRRNAALRVDEYLKKTQ
ncbi:MAG: hypothetical protein JWO09_2064 [Bacteroidetes bacterium]|nr:hypothetical protein [Bacteroidota bacterium]